MTRDAARAQQQQANPKPARMLRCQVQTINPATIVVTLPGGGTCTGLRVAGCTYTVGAAATVWIQEPAIGPVLPTAS